MKTTNTQTPFLSYTEDYQNIAEVFGRSPEIISSLMPFTQQVMRGNSELSGGEREVIAAYVSLLNGCKFCYGSHEQVAQNLNIDKTTIDALNEEPIGDVITDKMKAILNFTRKLTETPSRITKEDIQPILDTGWSEKTVEDVVYVVSLFAFYNRFADGLGFLGSREGFAMNGQFLAEKGYAF